MRAGGWGGLLDQCRFEEGGTPAAGQQNKCFFFHRTDRSKPLLQQLRSVRSGSDSSNNISLARMCPEAAMVLKPPTGWNMGDEDIFKVEYITFTL